MATRNFILRVNFACSLVACYLEKYTSEIELKFENFPQN